MENQEYHINYIYVNGQWYREIYFPSYNFASRIKITERDVPGMQPPMIKKPYIKLLLDV